MIEKLSYLSAYPEKIQAQVKQLISTNRLADHLLKKYPQIHTIRTDKTLYEYVHALKNDSMKNGDQINKVLFDSKIHVIKNALGTHTSISRVQGSKLKAKHEIRIASLFKKVPEEFLKMIVVHELAHLKIKPHDKSFYQLCCYMEPQYHQYELDCRLYLTQLEVLNKDVWK